MTVARDELDFDEVADLCVEVGSSVNPAELHGLLTGLLCSGSRFSQKAWLAQAAEFLDVAQPDDTVIVRELWQVYESALAELQNEAMAYSPLLPDESESMENRLLSLSEWCAGFLAGFAYSGRQAAASLSADTKDILEDIAAISQVEIESDEALDEADSQAWFEVVEYVRLAVISIFLECNEPEGEPTTVH